MTIALYCRVSTDEQVTSGFSIEGQMQRLEAYCKSQGWDDFEFYVDGGFSGTTMDRPQLKRLIRHIEKGNIESVIVYRLDRLSRRQRDLLFLLEEVFEPNGTAFRSATEPFDTSTPLGKAMLGILGVFAQLERDTIIERSRSGIAQRAHQGLWFGGPAPFGYDREGDSLVINPKQAPLVRAVYQQFLSGKPLLTIAQWLDKRDSSRYVDHSFIKDMLERPVYAGMVKHKDTVYQGNHEAIIDEETWHAVQEELKRRKEGRSPYGKYLLSGLVQCGVCGGNYKVQKRLEPRRKNYIYHYYMCATKQNKGKVACGPSKQIKLEKLEAQVIDRIKQLTLTPQLLEQELSQSHDNSMIKDEIAALKSELKDIQTKLDNLFNALRDGVFTARQLKRPVDELEERQQQIEERLDEITQHTKEDHQESIEASLDAIHKTWEYLNEDERREVLREAVSRIIVYPDRRPDIIWNL